MKNIVLTVGCCSITIPPNSPHKPSISAKLPQSKPSSSKPLLSTVQWDLSVHHNQNSLKYYAQLASKFAQGDKLDDFLLIAETVLNSSVKVSEFASLINVGLVSKGFRSGDVERVVEVLSGAQKLGLSVSQLFDGNANEALRKECRLVAERGDVEAVVDLLEILGGFHLSVKEIVDPAEIIRICVTKRQPNVAIRLARFGIVNDTHCCLCVGGHESTQHLFISCNYSSSVLCGFLCNIMGITWDSAGSCVDLLVKMLGLHDNTKKHVILLFLQIYAYHVWRERNARMHGKGIFNPRRLLDGIMVDLRARLHSSVWFNKLCCKRVELCSWLYV